MKNAEFIPQITRERFGSCTLGVDMLSCNNYSTNYVHGCYFQSTLHLSAASSSLLVSF